MRDSYHSEYKLDHDPGRFLSRYFNPESRFRTTPLRFKSVRKKYLRNADSLVSVKRNNIYAGALVFPQWMLLIPSQGRNDRPCVDHHHLAEGVEPPALHAALSQSTGDNLDLYMDENDLEPILVPRSWCTSSDVTVTSSEDPDRSSTERHQFVDVP